MQHQTLQCVVSRCFYSMTMYDCLIKGNIFRVTGPLWGEVTSTGEVPSQRPVTRSFDVFLGLWDAGDLRRHRAHYDVTVMLTKMFGETVSSLQLIVLAVFGTVVQPLAWGALVPLFWKLVLNDSWFVSLPFYMQYTIWWCHLGTNYDTTIPTIYFMMMIPQIWKRHVYQLKYLCVVCLRSVYVPSYLKVRINFHKWILALTPFMIQNRHVFVKSVYVYIHIYIYMLNEPKYVPHWSFWLLLVKICICSYTNGLRINNNLLPVA